MLKGNQLNKAMTLAGYTEKKPRRPHKDKEFKCHKCGQPMKKINETNVMVCTNDETHSNNYFIFSKI